MNPNRSTFRFQFMLGFLACCAMMAYAFYSQFVLHLNPCNLCIFQRIATIALGIVFLLGALAGPKSRGGRIIWGLVATLMAGDGMVVSGRHLWIQSL
ncbi:MAG: disulfide bond formation protein B, partial [Lysobacteraceae bacterium]